MKKGYSYSRLVVLALLGVILSACEAFGPVCVEADDFGDKLKKRVVVDADNDQWSNADLELVKGRPLRIITSSYVDLCYQPESVNKGDNSPSIGNGIQTVVKRPLANQQGWQALGHLINAGDDMMFRIEGSFSPYAEGQVGQICGKNEGACWLKDGKGAYVHIGTPPGAVDAPISSYGSTAYEGAGDRFFALDALKRYIEQYGEPLIEVEDEQAYQQRFGRPIDKIIPAPVSGQIYIRYEDNSTTNYSDNRGGYTLTFNQACHGTEGKFLAGWIGDNPPDRLYGDIDTDRLIVLHNYSGPVSRGTFNENVPVNGSLWLRVIDDRLMDWNRDGAPDNYYDDNYDNNFGQYLIDVTTIKPEDKTGNVIQDMIDPVRDYLYGTVDSNGDEITPGAAERFFTLITANGGFLTAVQAALVLAIVVYGLAYLLGMQRYTTQQDLIIFMFKMALIIQLMAPGSWNFFYETLFRGFVDGLDHLIYIMTSQTLVLTEPVLGSMQAQVNPSMVPDLSEHAFSFVGFTMTRFYLNEEVWFKIMGMLLALPIGTVYAGLILLGMGMFFVGVVRAVYVYLVSLIMLAVLFSVAPIFLVFLLFYYTKGMFDNWVKQTIGMMLQPVFLLAVLSIFSIFIYSALIYVLGFSVCWGCYHPLVLDLSFIPGAGDIEICWAWAYQPWGQDMADVSPPVGVEYRGPSFDAMPMSIFILLIFIIVCYALLHLSFWAERMGTFLVSGGVGIRISDAVGHATRDAKMIGRDAAKVTGEVAAVPLRVADTFVGSGLRRVGKVFGYNPKKKTVRNNINNVVNNVKNKQNPIKKK